MNLNNKNHNKQSARYVLSFYSSNTKLLRPVKVLLNEQMPKQQTPESPKKGMFALESSA